MKGYLYTAILLFLFGCVEVMDPFKEKLNGAELNEREIESEFTGQQQGFYYVDYDTITQELFIRYDAEIITQEEINNILERKKWLVHPVDTVEVALEVDVLEDSTEVFLEQEIEVSDSLQVKVDTILTDSTFSDSYL